MHDNTQEAGVAKDLNAVSRFLEPCRGELIKSGGPVQN